MSSHSVTHCKPFGLSPLKRLMLVFFASGMLNLIFSTSLSASENINTIPIYDLVQDCFDSGGFSPCRRALLTTEFLQRYAASRKNYSCQSRLLGLGADLIIARQQKGRGNFSYEMLEEVKYRCSNLF